MIDLSDGLARDLANLCRESSVSARIREDRIPVDPAARLIGRHLAEDPMALALGGGEDFELLFTSSADPPEILRLFSDGPDGPEVTEVGEVEEAGHGCLLVQQGGTEIPLIGGYDHFRRQ